MDVRTVHFVFACWLCALVAHCGETESDQSQIRELLRVQRRVQDVLERARRATVALEIGTGYGSGVIVRKDGLVVTAAHVATEPGRNVVVILHNGKRLTGRTLGLDHMNDIALIRIVDEGSWPALEVSKTAPDDGDWCLALGHPGGYRGGRKPVLRIGRILRQQRDELQTDCPLASGDSGGPLLDLDGRVIGIHRRIARGAVWNLHTSGRAVSRNQARLLAGESIGQ